jgi:hypothetical protein
MNRKKENDFPFMTMEFERDQKGLEGILPWIWDEFKRDLRGTQREEEKGFSPTPC